MRLHKIRPQSAMVLFVATLVLAGCTNSKILIAPLYNRLDDQIRSEFEKLGDFNEEQTAAFEASVGTFHVWHRQSELPQYAALLKSIADSIAIPGETRPEDIAQWFHRAETHSQAARECYPANFLIDQMQTLTDEQITFIEKRFDRERKKNRERYESRTAEERVKRRISNIDKWTGRINLKLTAAQRAAIRTSLTRQISLREEYYELSDQWKRTLFALARKQDQPGYVTGIRAHITKLWSLLESEHPEQWQANRTLWEETAYKLVQSMNAEQRKGSSRWLNGMADTLRAISTDKPSFQVGNDASVGCLVDASG